MEIRKHLNTAIAMFVEPRRGFASVESDGAAMVPVLLTILTSLGALVWYFQTVDFAWLQDYLTMSLSDPTHRGIARKVMTRNMLLTSSAISNVVMIPLLYCGLAAYFFVIAKLGNGQVGFGKWFAFVAWASLPALLLLPLAGTQMLLNGNGQIAPEQLNPATLNQLFFHLSAGDPWQGLLDRIDVTYLWSVVLMMIGFRVWTKASAAKSAAIVLAPNLLVFGGWALYLLASSAR